MWKHLEFFPESFFQLQDEISFHPNLQLLLAKHPADEFEIRMAEITAYCGIVLDGMYTMEDWDKICTACIGKLKQRAMDEAVKQYLGKKPN